MKTEKRASGSCSEVSNERDGASVAEDLLQADVTQILVVVEQVLILV
jgi:hypothetical protein